MSAGIHGHERPYEGKTNEWLTPKFIIDALGPFDLDPCASIERPFDCAKLNYTIKDDGLAQKWAKESLVWCNPPYGPHVGQWVDRMVEHNNGIMLVFARTDTRAMQRALKACSGVLFLSKRLKFLRPNGAQCNSGTAPSMIISFGAGTLARVQESKLEGVLMKRW